jgi:hypothetical protein
VFAVWDGGLGIWGGIAVATVVGVWRLRRHGVNVARFMDAVAPALLVAQGIGRIGNYFNKELFGEPTSLPWGLEIPYQYRVSGGIPARDLHFATFQPIFLYELIFDFALAGFLIWLGHHRHIRPPGLFALYVFGYSAYRIFEESLRIDSSAHFLGLRLNTYIASALAIVGAVWFYRTQRRPGPVAPPPPAGDAPARDAAPESQAHESQPHESRDSEQPATLPPGATGAPPDATGTMNHRAGQDRLDVPSCRSGEPEDAWMSTPTPSRMRSRPKPNSSSGSSAVSNTPAASSARSAGNRSGPASRPSRPA